MDSLPSVPTDCTEADRALRVVRPFPVLGWLSAPVSDRAPETGWRSTPARAKTVSATRRGKLSRTARRWLTPTHPLQKVPL